MEFHYSNDKPASPDSVVYRTDARQFVKVGRKVVANFDRDGVDGESGSDSDFRQFIESLYKSGMVMTEFDALLFDRGPGRLMADAGIATALAARSNLLTIRMFLHTLARGHRATEAGIGYPYFGEAYRSGGLKAIIERLMSLCNEAEDNGAATIYGLASKKRTVKAGSYS